MEIIDVAILTLSLTFVELSLLNFYLRKRTEVVRRDLEKLKALKTLELLERMITSFSEGSVSEVLTQSLLSVDIQGEIGTVIEFVNGKIPFIKKELEGISWLVKDLEELTSLDAKFSDYLRNSMLLGFLTLGLSLGYVTTGSTLFVGLELATLIYMSYFIVLSFRLLEVIKNMKRKAHLFKHP
ncbi:hypothetical protein HS1genome_0058 [Sulfodiicoccus acidiphilus]|uniref:Uncharacterized protein n=1 Tax=Sulfodiicoccus acidiphilus TaxID=1670455 RepID=A0A348B0G7_9CREN|nr:hypothetical protein [Sulfodiicoccus acidiphilus]BBD71669.1 hypothetical protein HS1genome_0058 [Sulfodiicoccus acidiphilus]GGT86726.1 hypothetical protein GCM10007116_00880 [Sulfodiicoccus acidiphilus]